MSLIPQRHEYPFYFVFTEDSVLRVPQLPDEVLVAILEHLPADELRRSCALCRKFRDLAYMAGLTTHRTISNTDQLAAWVQIVEYALLQKETFRLSVAIDHCGMQQGISEYLVMGTLSALSRALPRLARLRVNSSCYVIDFLLTTLEEPAPFLHALEIRHLDSDVNVSMTSLPPTLLNAQPASLRVVTLAVPLLTAVPAHVPALENVSVVYLTIGRQQYALAVARLFPSARELHLRVLGADHGVTIDLSQLSLRLLVIDNSYYGPGRALELTRCNGGRAPLIAAVEYTGACVPDHELLWSSQVRGVTGRMRRGGMSLCTSIEFSSADPAWRLIARLPRCSSWTPSTLAHLQRVPLVALAVDETLLAALIQAPISLPELGELSVDFCAAQRRTITQNGWEVPEETMHAIIAVSLGISYTLDFLCPLETLFAVSPQVVHFPKFVLFLCVLFASFGVLRMCEWLRRNAHDRARTQLSCPALERVTLCAGKDTPPVLCAARIAPVFELLAHSRVRPQLVLAGRVELDVWAKLSVMWRTFRIPVSV